MIVPTGSIDTIKREKYSSFYFWGDKLLIFLKQRPCILKRTGCTFVGNSKRFLGVWNFSDVSVAIY